MPKKKAEAISEAPVMSEVSSAIPQSSVLSGDVQAIDIYEKDTDQFIRQYSRQVHGDNFAELAESYLAGHPKCYKKS